jgi:tetratricopeptide (TPR) repeat protein/arylsulfatase A-like enzyme
MSAKVLLVGWDAADWKLIHPLIDRGLMPNTARMVERGVSARLATISPVLSPMLWTSIATGKRPFKHGILGFVEPNALGNGVQPVTNLSRKTKALWNILNQNGMRSMIVGWWPSHPAEPINGVMVSNHYHKAPAGVSTTWPMAPGTVHPATLADTLADLRLHPAELGPEHARPFVPEGERIDQNTDRRLDFILRTIAECTSIHACATHLLEQDSWDLAAVYFDAIDHFGHGFMKFHPPRQPFVSEKDFEIYQHVMNAAYVYHDMMLGRLMELAGDEATVILMSDHGFHPDHLRPSSLPMEPTGPAAEHRELGILTMRGPGIKSDELVHSATILDITPTILTLFGLPIGEDMDGRPLVDAFANPPRVTSIPSWDDVAGDDGQHARSHRLGVDQSRELIDQLVALGYIEQPSDDGTAAAAHARREMDYHLAQSYMDAGMYGSAAPILADLYHRWPLEFRFGINLAMCLHTLGMTDEMARLVTHLQAWWTRAASKAEWRLAAISGTVSERRRSRRDAHRSDVATQPQAEPLLSNEERNVVRALRAVALINEKTLDYLASMVAMSDHDYEAALARLDTARESQANAPGFHLKLGGAYLGLKRYADADASYRRALELDRDNAYAHLGLCRAALGRRRYREALDAATAAVGLKFHFPVAHYCLGLSRARLGDPEGAIQALEQALAQNPNFVEAHNRLAAIYEKQILDDARAKEHRWLAREVRRARRQIAAMPVIGDLPALDDHVLDELLPDFSRSVTPTLRPALSAGPIPTDRTAADETPFITVVSGLPRSGTSLMMQMLAAGGLAAHADDERPADESNPRGYFELEKVKHLGTDNAWLDEANGKALKVVAPLVPLLPRECRYRVVFMHRDLDEIIVSQARMLERLARRGGQLSHGQWRQLLERHVIQVRRLLDAHGVEVCDVHYADVLADPAGTAARLADFLRLPLDRSAMSNTVVPELHRSRSPQSSVPVSLAETSPA